MDEQTLPVRLRELAEALRYDKPGVPYPDVREALVGAADEIERLEAALAAAERGRDFYAERLAVAVLEGPQLLEQPPALGHVEAGDVLYALRYGLEHSEYLGTEHDLEMRRHALRLVAGTVRNGLAAAEREAHPVGSVVAELAGDGGVAAPMPRPRAFVAYYAEGWPLPGPGSFVQAGPIGSPWRVLSADRMEADAGEVVETFTDPGGAQRWPVRLVLEAVDPHDVPMTARAEVVPLPMEELGEVGA